MDRIYNEINKALLNDKKPSLILNRMLYDGKLQLYPFSMISALKDIKQNPKYHPEGNVWNHLMMVIDKGAEYRPYSEEPRVFMMALLLHDIGKVPTTKIRNGRWTSYDHDTAGEPLSREFLRYFNEDDEFIEKVSAEVRYHMHSLFICNNLPFSDINGMIKRTSLHELMLVTLSDRLGRGNMDKGKIDETIDSVNKFLDIVWKKFGVKRPEIPVLK